VRSIGQASKVFSAGLVGLLVTGAMCASALAAPAYHYDQALTEKLSGEVAFGRPWTLDFDAAGNLFAADQRGGSGETSIIDEFDPSGALLQRLGGGLLSSRFDRGVAVNDETGHVYSADSEPAEVTVMGAAGEELSAWSGAGTPAGIFGNFTYDAVDNSSSASKGDVYVYTSNSSGGEVDVFKPKDEDKEEGEYLRHLEAPGGFDFSGAAAGIAVVDRPGPEAGDVYVVDPGNKVVDRFSADGSFEVAHELKGISGGEPFPEPV
jgi:hypothetical protein